MHPSTLFPPITIGWFGIPGGKSGSLTHLVQSKKPLCGTHLHPESEYQWCIPIWTDGTPECERCKKIQHRMAAENVFKAEQDFVAKAKMNVHYSSNTNEWATPQPLFNWLNNKYQFTLDPCCTDKTAKCKKYYTQAQNGLKQDWSKDRVFCNPPYGREIGKWVKKAYEESLKGATVACLIPARTDTQWWNDYCTKADSIIFITGRIKFQNTEGQFLTAPAPFPSCVVVFRKDRHSGNFPPLIWWENVRSMTA